MSSARNASATSAMCLWHRDRNPARVTQVCFQFRLTPAIEAAVGHNVFFGSPASLPASCDRVYEPMRTECVLCAPGTRRHPVAFILVVLFSLLTYFWA
ncbi:hypothetical protein K466DRAFT_203339 [Polyporus arcularius HHB13444]|uniref:Uncharacterized protein n=1 Tax=Polyporus arcularius HHB13444 TaxID=1314778 RepID=A0A5C3P725_9APHY|nr:hypothetical protein K466DRAFT_203339 [Polyporus arcularius HHB13444]